MCTPAQVDAVEIAGEYLLFSQPPIQPECGERLAQLAAERPIIPQNSHLDELLGYGAATLDDFARFRVAACRAHDPHRVDPKVVVEASVLGAEDCLHQAIGEFLTRGVCELERSNTPKRGPVC